ncbi:MAG: hypothetical protein KatS3mg060_2149 [Dehalococcoidia bacterium]|nr:MAG: hypothetical protein KatS3mg060_2149 [Dehalococcoidia bacterium]
MDHWLLTVTRGEEMRSTRLLPIVGCGALATLTFLALCAGGALLGLAWNVRASADAVSAPPVRTTTVAMRNDRFIPAHIEVSPGTTVTWHNDDAQRHNVVLPEQRASR